MLTKTQEHILKFLFETKEEKHTIRGISKKLKKSYTLTYNNIINLEKEGIILAESVPPSKIIRLNEKAPEEIFIDLELKRKNGFLTKHPWIKLMLKDMMKNILNPFFILLVFGSYAKGVQDEKSDLDLLIIVWDKKQISSMKAAVLGVYTKIKKSLNVVDIEEFKEMLNGERINIGGEAKKNHILLYGVEQYYNLIKNR